MIVVLLVLDLGKIGPLRGPVRVTKKSIGTRVARVIVLGQNYGMGTSRLAFKVGGNSSLRRHLKKIIGR